MAEVNWNAKTGKFEVALCVWPADLEKALGQQEGRTIDLAKEPNVDQMMEAYVAKRFFLRTEPTRAEKVAKKNRSAGAGAEPRSGQRLETSPKANLDSAKLAKTKLTKTKLADSDSAPAAVGHSSSAESKAAKAEAANWLVAAGQVGESSNSNRQPGKSDGLARKAKPVLVDDDALRVDAAKELDEREAKRDAKRDAKGAIKWYGHEADPKQAWLYFELDGNLAGKLTFENRIFFELNDDQLNHIQWSGGGKAETLVVSPDDPNITLPTRAFKRSPAVPAVGEKESANPIVN
jgi:hypothetical protein